MFCFQCVKTTPLASLARAGLRVVPKFSSRQSSGMRASYLSHTLSRTFYILEPRRTNPSACNPSGLSISLAATGAVPARASLQTSSTPIPPMVRAFSTSAELSGKRQTFNPSWRVRKRRHGFLARLKSKSGQKVLARRRAKGRRALSW
ncbi:hypothetical protein KEM54_001788 [Ascosphaera aggregata]|nr:hypothetical protein KEM54_001788 [Ascosphaera aggregata]